MRYGTVVKYFPAKGFGFIRPDVGKDIFFHVSALGACEAEPSIEPGQPVKYELEPRKRLAEGELPPPQERSGPQARLVELIDALPGGVAKEDASLRTPRHPKARGKKAPWKND